MKDFLKGCIAGIIVVAVFWSGYYFGYAKAHQEQQVEEVFNALAVDIPDRYLNATTTGNTYKNICNHAADVSKEPECFKKQR